MKMKPTALSPTIGRSKRPFWIIALSAFGMVGLFFTGLQVYPRCAASYWRRQLDDAPEERVEVILDRITELDEAGIPVLVDALGSERETVALAAKRRLLDRLEHWKALSEEERSLRLLTLAETLAAHVAAFGPTAREDASDLASLILLNPSSSESSRDRSRLIAACDDIFQATAAVQGESSPTSKVHAVSVRQAEEDRASYRSLASEQWNSEKTAAMQFDLLPGGGLPIGEQPAEERTSDHVLPGENGEVPPAFFQEPSGTRALDFSNQMAHPLHVRETASPQNDQKTPATGEDRQIRSMSHDESKSRGDTAALNLRMCETLDLMRQLSDADEDRAKPLQAELRRRGLSAAEIDLAGRLFDSDPAVRKRLVAELPGMADIDASAWLLQCCKDGDADVRLASFSLLATSTNPLLLQKLKVLAQNDADARIQHVAEQIHDDRNR